MDTDTKKLKFGVIGAGFWSSFQLNGWKELGNVDCVAIYNRTWSRAEELARRFSISDVYDDVGELLSRDDLDFVDVVTGPASHPQFVEMAAKRGIPVVCQKPMANSLNEAESMVKVCRDTGVPFLVNENWRWQAPIREVKAILDQGDIGRPFRARIDLITGFPVFENQPFLRQLDQFILTDLGSHLLDVSRFLFGEAASVYCHTDKIHSDIAGEDVATVFLRMQSGMSVLVEMAYVENFIEDDCFPETKVFVEGEHGSLKLKSDYRIHVTTREGTRLMRIPPPHYDWIDPRYAVVHSSIVPCHRDLLNSLLGHGGAETSAIDNIKTVRLVFAAYESARTGALIEVS